MEKAEKVHKLTERQELFCIEYVLNKGNATEAARRAGYSDSSDEVLCQIGYATLRNVEVISRIALLREQSGTKTGANVEWLTSILVSAIERCMQKEEIFDSDGNPTGEYKFDSKGVSANSSVLMKLMGWDVKKETPNEPMPFKIVRVENFAGFKKPINAGIDSPAE